MNPNKKYLSDLLLGKDLTLHLITYNNLKFFSKCLVRLPIIPVKRYRRNHGDSEVQRLRRQGDSEESESQRYRRQGGGHEGVTGPVHTFVKTDEHAHFKWGVRHHVGHEYAGRR